MKKGGVCEIFVKNVKEDQLPSIIRRKVEYFIGLPVTIVPRVIKQKGIHG